MIKERLREQYGTLRAAAAEHGINYYRLSQICNGWVKPNNEETKALKITPQEIKKTLKVSDGRAS